MLPHGTQYGDFLRLGGTLLEGHPTYKYSIFIPSKCSYPPRRLLHSWGCGLPVPRSVVSHQLPYGECTLSVTPPLLTDDPTLLYAQLSALHCVHEAFTEGESTLSLLPHPHSNITHTHTHTHTHSVTSYARYDPSKGYSWVFPSETSQDEPVSRQPQSEQPSDEQRRRVDRLLTDLMLKFPPKAFGRKASVLA